MTTEVTQDQWEAVLGDNPSSDPECGPNCPINRVSRWRTEEFITELNARTGGHYRLPTEAGWECASRAGTTTRYRRGDEIGTGLANGYDRGAPLPPPRPGRLPRRQPVGALRHPGQRRRVG